MMQSILCHNEEDLHWFTKNVLTCGLEDAEKEKEQEREKEKEKESYTKSKGKVKGKAAKLKVKGKGKGKEEEKENEEETQSEDQVQSDDRAYSILQRLLCPYSIETANHYEQYELVPYMWNKFRDEIVPLSSSVKLQACAHILLQHMSNMMLQGASGAPLPYIQFLCEEAKADPNVFYHYQCQVEERQKLQSLYEELIHDKTGFSDDAAKLVFLDEVQQRMVPNPLNQLKGSSILFNLSGNNCGAKFAYLVEKAHANPLFLKTATPEYKPFCLSPYHNASRECLKSIIAYYFKQGLIPHVNDFF
jgi:hypothetical protein